MVYVYACAKFDAPSSQRNLAGCPAVSRVLAIPIASAIVTASQQFLDRSRVSLGAALGLLFSLLLFLGGCRSGSEDVVVYSALDRDFAAPILDDVARSSGLKP